MKYEFDGFKDYANKVINGEIVAGKLVKLACQRYLSWFDRDDMYFDERKALKPVKFISLLKHTEGKFSHKPFILQDWQQFLVYHMYGWYWKRNNKRVIRNVYVQLSRKCGKTALSSALCLYSLIADGENGAEVYCVAPSRSQSAIAFRYASNYAETINKGTVLRCLRGNIFFDATKSKMQIFSSDAKYGDGYSPHFALLDEYHIFPNNDVLNLLRSGMGMRENPMLVCITTAGMNINCPCKEYRDMCIDILNGKKIDDSTLALIYELDDESEWENEDCWKKCCPSLDITVTTDYMQQQVTLAKNNPSDSVPVKIKTFNIWCQSSDIWIDNDLLKKYSEKFELQDLLKLRESGEYTECYVGVDLASTRDLTSVTCMVPIKDKYYFKTWCFLPEAQINNGHNGANTKIYEDAVRMKLLILSKGNTTNYDDVTNLVVAINEIFPICKIAYDRALSGGWAKQMEDYDLPMYQYAQGLYNFTVPTKEFERLMYADEGKIVLDDNALVRWAFANVVLKVDVIGNCKPMKGPNFENKIDPVITILMSLGAYLLDHDGAWSYKAMALD